jgi:hypothetical protein
MGYFPKQTASRIIAQNVIAYTGNQTASATSNFRGETFQVRVQIYRFGLDSHRQWHGRDEQRRHAAARQSADQSISPASRVKVCRLTRPALAAAMSRFQKCRDRRFQ